MAVIVGKWKHELKVRDNSESGVLIEVVGRKSESIPLREECGSEKLRQLPLRSYHRQRSRRLFNSLSCSFPTFQNEPGKRHTTSIALVSICGPATLAITIPARLSELVDPQLNDISVCPIVTVELWTDDSSVRNEGYFISSGGLPCMSCGW